jgi:hypothetical protein
MYNAHIQQLARDYDVTLLIDPYLDPKRASSEPVDRRVLLPPITDATTYAIALHEIGHVASGHTMPSAFIYLIGGGRAVMSVEMEAWRWARQHALEWTPEMTAIEQWGLDSYRRDFLLP